MRFDGDPRFERVLRGCLNLLAEEQPLDASVPLADLGLDSMGTIQLLLEVEEEFGVSFPDETLTAETFATAGALWKVVVDLMSAMDGEPRR